MEFMAAASLGSVEIYSYVWKHAYIEHFNQHMRLLVILVKMALQSIDVHLE